MALSALATEIDGALVEIDSLLVDSEGTYTTFTWRPNQGAVEVRCTPNMATRGSVVILGGQEIEVAFSLNVRLSHFLTVDSTLITVDSELYTADNDTPRPISGMILKFRGRTYKIGSAAVDPTGVYVHLTLVDRHSGKG